MKNDDLLNIGNNNKKDFKKILVYGAGAFLVFVIAIIGVAIYQNSKSKNDENAILPPQVNNQTQNQELFKEVPIENQEIQTKPQTNRAKEKKSNLTEKLVEEKNTNNFQKPQIETKKDTNVAKTKKEIKKTEKKTIKNISKKIVKIKYYIQVAALMKYSKPNKKFLKLIEKYGYNYKFYTVYVKRNNEKIKVTKILVGPFNSKAKALKNLQKIKKHITQNAFIFKVQ